MQQPAFKKLRSWLTVHGRNDRWLAAQIGTSQPQANRIINGKARTSPERAVAIEKLTKGSVKAVAILTDPLDLEAANDNETRDEAVRA